MTKIPIIELNLPKAQLRIEQEKEHLMVYDIVRKKKIILEPEEWVRQNLIHYFINHLNYPLGLFQVEAPVVVNEMNQRADIIIYNQEGKPFLLVECKSYDVDLDDRVLHQAIRYNKVLKAEFIFISNGLEHHCLKWNRKTGMLKAMKAFPEYVNNSSVS